MRASAGKKRIQWVTNKHHGTRTEEELEALREKYRGNLDPEIHVLIERYGLNREDDTF